MYFRSTSFVTHRNHIGEFFFINHDYEAKNLCIGPGNELFRSLAVTWVKNSPQMASKCSGSSAPFETSKLCVIFSDTARFQMLLYHKDNFKSYNVFYFGGMDMQAAAKSHINSSSEWISVIWLSNMFNRDNCGVLWIVLIIILVILRYNSVQNLWTGIEPYPCQQYAANVEVRGDNYTGVHYQLCNTIKEFPLI